MRIQYFLALSVYGLSPVVAQAQALAPGPGPEDGEHQIVVDGVRLWYRVVGSGADGVPPVVFLHGGPGQGSHHFEVTVGPDMETFLRMVYFDQRGSGRSERPWTGEYSISALVDDIEGLRRALSVPEITLLGHSFGGMLALEYAARYPDRVASLVIVAGMWDLTVQCPLRLAVLAERAPDVHARVHSDTLRSDGSRRSDCELEFDAFRSRAERDAFNNAIMFPDSSTRLQLDSLTAASGLRNTGELGSALFSSGLLDYRFTGLSSIAVPVVVIAGRHDGAAVAEGLEALASRLPNATFLEFEDSGHFVYLDEPDRFVREVTRFVSQASERNGG